MAAIATSKFPLPPDPRSKNDVIDPPTQRRDILRNIGPGLIIAGALVGSGELIATTKTGAQAGIFLLWLIILACVIKVFVQVEIGRHTITHGETTLSALNSFNLQDKSTIPRCQDLERSFRAKTWRHCEHLFDIASED